MILKRNGITFMRLTETTGRYYAYGKWIGNFYVDTNGNIHDTETNVII